MINTGFQTNIYPPGHQSKLIQVVGTILRPKTMFPRSKHTNGLNPAQGLRPWHLGPRPPATSEIRAAVPNRHKLSHMLLRARAAALQEQGCGAQPRTCPNSFSNIPKPPKSCLNITKSSNQSSQASQWSKTIKTQGSNKPKTQQFTKSIQSLETRKNSKLKLRLPSIGLFSVESFG